jgi:endonuclease/exonuclease/phosphatase family metal-dependent hydrolase
MFRHKETGKKVCFMNVHFDHRGVQARLEASKQIVAYVKKHCKGAKVVISGDFNVTQNSESYLHLANSKVLKDSYDLAKYRFEPTGTFNGFNARRYTNCRIDHLFVAKGTKVSRWGVLTYHYYLDKYALQGIEAPAVIKGEKREVKCISDHYAIQAFIKL